MPDRPPRLQLHRRGLGATEDQYAVLRDWVAELASPGCRLLDVGAGDGDDGYAALLRPLVAEVVGVDPDPGIRRNVLLDRRYEMPVERFAANRLEEPFELAVAVYVAEHVSHPAAFLGSVRACLRPGGSLILVTPNLWHYFGLAAKSTMVLGLDDALLRFARASHPGHAHVAHFRVAYKMNSGAALEREAASAGFVSGEIRYLENPAIFETYFPTRLSWLPRGYSSAVHRLGLEALYGTVLCRLVTGEVQAAD
ncbi:MAG: methyltransferase domain-containing protein [Actinomycetota bacterium]|nr:methyltransferase domain-containing protein [Actinomycetota bacterium]